MKNIVSFSGGKDSTAMLLMLFEKGVKVDRIINIDTTKEFPAMYDHIKRVQELVPVKIETYSFDFDWNFSERVRTRGSRIGQKGYAWPTAMIRWCTAEKRGLVSRALKGEKDFQMFIGIAADEPKRLGKKHGTGYPCAYPLAEWGITEADALKYCYSKGLDWGGCTTRDGSACRATAARCRI